MKITDGSSMLLIIALVWPAVAARDTITQNKNVTVIQAQSTADGKSSMREQILEECIVSLPSSEQVEAQTNAESVFLREINGDPNRNEFVKTYSAAIDVNYMLYQKVLVVVTTNSVPSQEPVMKILEKNTRQTKSFRSNSANGDLYAGKSNRQHYFSTPEGAIQDARKQAQTWIKQQSSVICKSKSGQ